MSAIAHLLDDPVYDRLADFARHLVDEAEHLLTGFQAAQAARESVVPRVPPARPLSGTEFRMWVTGLERETIHATGKALERVGHAIEKCEQRLAVTPGGTAPLDLTGQAAVLVEATRLLVTLVSSLRRMAELDQARELLNQLRTCEAASDRLEAEGLRALYAGQFEPGKLSALKDLIDLLGDAVEGCGAAADLIWRIFLENN